MLEQADDADADGTIAELQDLVARQAEDLRHKDAKIAELEAQAELRAAERERGSLTRVKSLPPYRPQDLGSEVSQLCALAGRQDEELCRAGLEFERLRGVVGRRDGELRAACARVESAHAAQSRMHNELQDASNELECLQAAFGCGEAEAQRAGVELSYFKAVLDKKDFELQSTSAELALARECQGRQQQELRAAGEELLRLRGAVGEQECELSAALEGLALLRTEKEQSDTDLHLTRAELVQYLALSELVPRAAELEEGAAALVGCSALPGGNADAYMQRLSGAIERVHQALERVRAARCAASRAEEALAASSPRTTSCSSELAPSDSFLERVALLDRDRQQNGDFAQAPSLGSASSSRQIDEDLVERLFSEIEHIQSKVKQTSFEVGLLPSEAEAEPLLGEAHLTALYADMECQEAKLAHATVRLEQLHTEMSQGSQSGSCLGFSGSSSPRLSDLGELLGGRVPGHLGPASEL